MNYCIVHYNTPDLLMCTLSSLIKTNERNIQTIYIFDNSDIKPFTYYDCFDVNIQYFDNTQQSLLNFDKLFKKLPKDEQIVSNNNLGSAKHALTVDLLIKSLDEQEICLLDSDVLVKTEINFTNSHFAAIGELNSKEILRDNRKMRILPFLQYFNLKMLRKHKISYFDYTRIMGFNEDKRKYDTGTSFLEDIILKSLPIKCIDLDKYILHFGGGSWRNKNYKCWLLDNKKLWQNTQ